MERRYHTILEINENSSNSINGYFGERNLLYITVLFAGRSLLEVLKFKVDQTWIKFFKFFKDFIQECSNILV